MKYLRLITIQYKNGLKDWKTIFFLFLFPIIIVAFSLYASNTDDGQSSDGVIIINQDDGHLAEEIIAALDVDIIMEDNLDIALEMLEDDKAIAVYIFNKDFSKEINNVTMPQILSYKIESEYTTLSVLYDRQIESLVQEKLKTVMFAEYGLNYQEFNELSLITTNLVYPNNPLLGGQGAAVLIVIFFMFMTSDNIARDLFHLRNSKVLRRLMTTNNSNFEIISSFCLGNFLLQTSLSLISFLTLRFVFQYSPDNFGLVVLTIVLMSIVSISLSILVVRIFKREDILSAVGSLLNIILFFAGLTVVLKDVLTLPGVFLALVQFSPFYWAYDMVFYQNMLPNIFILLLMAGVMLTAGSYKLEKFVEG